MNIALTKNSSDVEIMAEFESLRAQACGEEIGTLKQTPTEAVAAEGWTLIRTIQHGTNNPGTPVLAEDGRGNLWVVNDLDGPWAIQVGESQ